MSDWKCDRDHGWWRYWHVVDGGTTRRSLRLRIGRITWQWTLFVHHYHADTTNRVVWQTSHHYDCKRWGRS